MPEGMEAGYYRDADGNLVVIAPGEGDAWESGFVRSDKGALVVVGPEGQEVGGVSKEEFEALQNEVADVDTDVTAAANSDVRVMSQKASRTYIANNTSPGLSGLILPVASNLVSSSVAAVALTPFFVRVIAPRDGTIKDLSYFTKTKAGNVAMAIYDTGNAEAGKRTKLYETGSVTVGTAANWQIMKANTEITCKAGQHFDILVAFSETPEIGRVSNTSAAASQWGESDMPCAGGALPKLGGTTPVIASLTGFTTTIAEASMTPTVTIAAVKARVG